jgi:hypothetical protein
MAESYIITESEARDYLRLDSDYPQSELLSDLAEATAYVDDRSGHSWEADSTIDPEAKTACKMKLAMLFHPAEPDYDFKVRLDEVVGWLRTKARSS